MCTCIFRGSHKHHSGGHQFSSRQVVLLANVCLYFSYFSSFYLDSALPTQPNRARGLHRSTAAVQLCLSFHCGLQLHHHRLHGLRSGGPGRIQTITNISKLVKRLQQRETQAADHQHCHIVKYILNVLANGAFLSLV